MIEFKKPNIKESFCGFTVTKSDHNMMKKLAKKHGVSVSEYARTIVLNYMQSEVENANQSKQINDTKL